MTRRFLVTGAQGFIGRYFISHLLDCFPQTAVLGIGRSPGQNSTFLHHVTCGDRVVLAPLPEHLRYVDRYSYIPCELSSTKLTELIRDFHPTAIIHLAASLRGISEEVIFENNVRCTQGLLDSIHASRAPLTLLLLASSGGVYATQQSLPFTETSPVQPVDLYSRSKLAAEDLARSFATQTGIPTAIARIFNVLGPGQDELHFAGRMAGQVAAILVGKSTPVIWAGPLSATRDYLDVRDVCSALGMLLERELEGLYNVASGIETNTGDLLQLFIQAAGLQSAVEIKQERCGPDPIPRHFASIDRLTKAGFSPRYSIAHIASDMLNYYTRLIYTGFRT
jgi:nucleoside-diphosphate-sugar epimerase